MKYIAWGAIAILCSFILVMTLPSSVQSPSSFEYDFVYPASLALGDYKLAIVESDAERIRGLSKHRPLAPNEGLLFEFPTPDFYGIWMKDMLFAIDVIWFDSDYTVVHIVENFMPESYPKVLKPDTPSRFVLELPAGSVERTKVKIGAQLNFFDERPKKE